jgi:hypothetical protein
VPSFQQVKLIEFFVKIFPGRLDLWIENEQGISLVDILLSSDASSLWYRILTAPSLSQKMFERISVSQMICVYSQISTIMAFSSAPDSFMPQRAFELVEEANSSETFDAMFKFYQRFKKSQIHSNKPENEYAQQFADRYRDAIPAPSASTELRIARLLEQISSHAT